MRLDKGLDKIKGQLESALEYINQDSQHSINAVQQLRVEKDMLPVLQDKPLIFINNMSITMVSVSLAISDALRVVDRMALLCAGAQATKEVRVCPSCKAPRFAIQTTHKNTAYLKCKACGYKEKRDNIGLKRIGGTKEVLNKKCEVLP